MSNRNVAEIAYAISLSSASITGAIAAIAEPPQIPVPAEIRFESFQFILKSRPKRFPNPNAATSVNDITISENFPTFRTCEKLSVNPISTIPAFRIVFETNASPPAKPSLPSFVQTRLRSF